MKIIIRKKQARQIKHNKYTNKNKNKIRTHPQ